MKRIPWHHSRFDQQDEDPLGPLANLVDVMLVFICGLIAVLFSINPEFKQQLKQQQEIKQGQEMPELPQGFGEAGSGFENVGTVYRDPQTGKLIMVGSETK